MKTLMSWIFVQIMYFLMEVNIYNILEQATVYAQDDTSENPNVLEEYEEDAQNSSKGDYYACEKEINLYVLQQELFTKEDFSGEINTPKARLGWGIKIVTILLICCTLRNYYVKKIPYSNLIFVAINNTIKKNSNLYFNTEPKQITDEPVFQLKYMNTTLLPCKKLDLNNLPRRRLTGCYNEHPLVGCLYGSLKRYKS